MKVYAILALVVVVIGGLASFIGYIDHNAVVRAEHARTMEALKHQKEVREQTEELATEAVSAHEETRQKAAVRIEGLQAELAVLDAQIEAERAAAEAARLEAAAWKAAGGEGEPPPDVVQPPPDPYCRAGCILR